MPFYVLCQLSDRTNDENKVKSAVVEAQTLKLAIYQTPISSWSEQNDLYKHFNNQNDQNTCKTAKRFNTSLQYDSPLGFFSLLTSKINDWNTQTRCLRKASKHFLHSFNSSNIFAD